MNHGLPTKIETVEDCGNGYGWSLVRMPNDTFEIAILRDGGIPQNVYFILGGVKPVASILDASYVMADIARLARN